MIRTCKICSATSDNVDFYASITSRCKQCHKSKVSENRAEKVEYYRAYNAHRFKHDPRVLERHKRYAKSDAGKASALKARKKWQAQHPDRRAAHVILGNAVRDGRISKPANCAICGIGGRIHGHHDDYAKPLEVTWCCSKCHTEIHRKDAANAATQAGKEA